MAGSSSSSRTTAKTPPSGKPKEMRRSPIPYRVGLLDYHPPMYCDCQQKAAMWISWSDENPNGATSSATELGHRSQICTMSCGLSRRRKQHRTELLVEATARVDSLEKKLVAAMKKEEHKVDALKSKKEDLKAEARKLEVEKTGLKAFCMFFVVVVLFMWRIDN
ncbi:hypothetical protein QOZ80_7AG0564170 [Eleusine coracana subsp. coracana]|nr:hypothetical protein QOZ80_7AG0564170 [Eleusine coracana subsp. coracana]